MRASAPFVSDVLPAPSSPVPSHSHSISPRSPQCPQPVATQPLSDVYAALDVQSEQAAPLAPTPLILHSNRRPSSLGLQLRSPSDQSTVVQALGLPRLRGCLQMGRPQAVLSALAGGVLPARHYR